MRKLDCSVEISKAEIVQVRWQIFMKVSSTPQLARFKRIKV